MKMTLKIVLGLLCLVATGCTDYTSDIYIEKDGSGRAVTEIDASSMLAMVGMMGAAQDTAAMIDPDNPQMFLSSLLADGQDVDTTIAFSEMMPESLLVGVDRPELLQNISIRLQTEMEQEAATMWMRINFSDEEEFHATQDALKQMSEGSPMGAGGGEPQGTFAFDGPFTKGRLAVPAQDMQAQMAAQGVDFASMDDDQLAFMEEMLGETGITVNYHFPGKILTATDSVVTIIDDRTASVKQDMMEILREGKSPGYVITYDTSEMTNR